MKNNFMPRELTADKGGVFEFNQWPLFGSKDLDYSIYSKLNDAFNYEPEVLTIQTRDVDESGDIPIICYFWMHDSEDPGHDNPHIKTSLMRVINDWVFKYAERWTEKELSIDNSDSPDSIDDARRLVAALRLKADQIEAIIKDG